MKRRMNPVMNTNRFKNVGFWIGIVGIVLTAAGIDATTLTSWNLLFNSILDVLKNPYLLGCTILAVLGVVVNPTTKGLRDNKKVNK